MLPPDCLGEDVTLPDGRVVLSKDVLSPEEPSKSYMIVEAPDTAYIDSLIHNEVLGKRRNDDNLEVVFHFTPGDVVRHPAYRAWMEEFSGHVKHVLINSENPGLGLTGINSPNPIL